MSALNRCVLRCSALHLQLWKPSVLPANLPPHPNSRTIFKWAHKRKFTPRHERDGVGKESELIYANSNGFMLYATLGATTVAALPPTVLSVLHAYQLRDQLPDALFDINQPLLPAVLMGSFGLVLAACVYRVLLPGVARIYFRQRDATYTLVPVRAPLRRPNIQFKAEDVRWRENMGLMKEMTGNFKIKGRTTYVLSKDFKHRSYFLQFSQEASRLRYVQ